MLLYNLLVCVSVRTIGICISFFPLKIEPNESSRMFTLFNLWLQVSKLLLPPSTKHIFLSEVKTLRGIHFMNY